jgi:outer membrane protein assembly factor BamB
VAYSNSGTPLWTNRYQGPGGGYNTPSDITTDIAGTIYVTGYSAGSLEAFGYATVAYASSGFPLWTNRYDPLFFGNNEPAAIAVDSAGSVYVTGSSLNTNGTFGYATIKYVAPLLIVNGGSNFGVNGNTFGFDVYGPAGSSAIIQGSTDLKVWTPLQTNVLLGGFCHFSENVQPNGLSRFYRISSP